MDEIAISLLASSSSKTHVEMDALRLLNSNVLLTTNDNYTIFYRPNRPNMETTMNTPICPFCDKHVHGEMKLYGGEPLHAECYAELGREMERVDIEHRFPLSPDTVLDTLMWELRKFARRVLNFIYN